MAKKKRINWRYDKDKDWIDKMADAKNKKEKNLARRIEEKLEKGLELLKSPKLWKNVGIVLLLLLWVGVVLFATQFCLKHLFRWIFPDNLDSVMVQALYTFVVDGIALALIILLPWKILKKKTTLKEMGVEGNLTWTDIGLAPIGFFAYIIMAMIGQWLLPAVDWQAEQDIGYNLSNLIGTDLLMVFFAVVIIAPIAEELIFRGWLYGKIKQIVPTWLAVILVSVLFGIMHGQVNVGINVFFLSIALCMLREMTGTIYSGVLLHMLKNGIALAFLLWSENPYIFN